MIQILSLTCRELYRFDLKHCASPGYWAHLYSVCRWSVPVTRSSRHKKVTIVKVSGLMLPVFHFLVSKNNSVRHIVFFTCDWNNHSNTSHLNICILAGSRMMAILICFRDNMGTIQEMLLECHLFLSLLSLSLTVLEFFSCFQCELMYFFGPSSPR